MAGSSQVRARQVTGSASPRTSIERPARHEVDDERAVRPPRADRPRPRVVGEQPLPALRVAGEREDQRRGRRDVDARSCCASQAPAMAMASTRRDRRDGATASSGVNQPHVSVEPSTRRELAAGDPDAIDDPDGVHLRAVVSGRPATTHRQLIDLALVARFLGSSRRTPTRVVRRSRARRPAASRPAGDDRRRDATQEDPARVVEGERVRRRPGRVAPRPLGHGASSDARKRGSSARDAGTRSPITRPIVARTDGRAATRRAA